MHSWIRLKGAHDFPGPVRKSVHAGHPDREVNPGGALPLGVYGMPCQESPGLVIPLEPRPSVPKAAR